MDAKWEFPQLGARIMLLYYIELWREFNIDSSCYITSLAKNGNLVKMTRFEQTSRMKKHSRLKPKLLVLG